MEQLKLNMIPNGVNPVFHASQYDKGRQIRFILDETLSGAEVATSYRAKDGTEYGNVQMSVSGNTITDTIPEEVLTDYGMIEGEVNIDGIGSLNFFVEVEKDAYDGGVITTQTASGPIATFETNIETAFVSLKSDINPVQSGTGTPSPQNVRPISGFSALNVILADGDMQTVDTKTVNFGQTVYGGEVDVTNGKVNVTHGIVDLGSLSWTKDTTTLSVTVFRANIGDRKGGSTDLICTNYEALSGDRGLLVNNNNTIATWNKQASQNVAIRDDNLSSGDATAFKTAMSGVMLCYELATPIEITTTPENLTAISGENNVYGDTNGDTEVEYYIEV